MKPEVEFVPGELVLLVGARRFTDLNNRAFEIESVFWSDEFSGWRYFLVGVEVLSPSGNRAYARPSQLRRLPPEILVAFDASIWKPQGVTE